MLSIDTERLKEVTMAAQAAMNAVDHAAGLLNQVIEHDDWGCKERVIINQYIQENRQQIKRLQENSANYCQVLLQVLDELVAEEQGISRMFAEVETLLSRALTISGTGTAAVSPGGISSIVADISNTDKGYSENMAGGADLEGDIGVADFQELLHGIEGANA